MATKLVPILHRILVMPIQAEEYDPVVARAKKAGIAFAPTAERKYQRSGIDRGKVVAFGPTVFKDFNMENPLKVGDMISYAKHSGKWVQDPSDPENPDAEMLIINDEDVIAIFQEGDE